MWPGAADAGTARTVEPYGRSAPPLPEAAGADEDAPAEPTPERAVAE
jgi:hypothetical protein